MNASTAPTTQNHAQNTHTRYSTARTSLSRLVSLERRSPLVGHTLFAHDFDMMWLASFDPACPWRVLSLLLWPCICEYMAVHL